MKPDYELQRAHERQQVIERAVQIGVKSIRTRGKNLVELDAEELGRLVDRVERYENLLRIVAGAALGKSLVDDINNALAGR